METPIPDYLAEVLAACAADASGAGEPVLVTLDCAASAGAGGGGLQEVAPHRFAPGGGR